MKDKSSSPSGETCESEEGDKESSFSCSSPIELGLSKFTKKYPIFELERVNANSKEKPLGINLELALYRAKVLDSWPGIFVSEKLRNFFSRFQVFGGEPNMRSTEDIAFFIAKKGSNVNYYMYHGGTNFGRLTSSYITTSYYDQAPLDEYGMIRQPKWGHLKQLHEAVKQCIGPLLWGTSTNFSIGPLQEMKIGALD